MLFEFHLLGKILTSQLSNKWYSLFRNCTFNNVCFVCCPSWLPNKVELGEIPLKDVYNSEPIIDIRNSILDGSFKYCSKELCPYLSKLVNYGVASGPVSLKENSMRILCFCMLVNLQNLSPGQMKIPFGAQCLG